MGPLKGLKILEFSGIGPGPFCGMLLADLGAEVIRLDKSSSHGNHNKADIHNRNKKSITVDLKNPKSILEVKKLISQMDGIFEGFRPGVMERLGLGPKECLDLNKSLVYGPYEALDYVDRLWTIQIITLWTIWIGSTHEA